MSLINPNLGASDPDILGVGLYSAATGTFDLGAETDLATCNHCVIAFEDVTNTGTGRYYFQASGSMTVTQANSSTPVFSTGTLSNVKLIEVTLDSTGTVATPVANGKCLMLNSASWSVANSCTDGGPEYNTNQSTDCQTCGTAEQGTGGCCESESTTCANNSECVALDTCLRACASGDTTCQNTCASNHSAGVSDYNAWGVCLVGDGSTTNGACGLVCQ